MNLSLAGRREKLRIDLGRHEKGSNGSASNEEYPDGRPSEVFLKRTHGQKTDGSRDGTASVDKSRNSTNGFVVSLDRWVGSKIGGDGRSDDVVWSKSFGQKEHEKTNKQKGTGITSRGKIKIEQCK
jgi:hypothetical protein